MWSWKDWTEVKVEADSISIKWSDLSQLYPLERSYTRRNDFAINQNRTLSRHLIAISFDLAARCYQSQYKSERVENNNPPVETASCIISKK